MGKLSKVRLHKKQEKWQYEGVKEEELIFLCGSDEGKKERPSRKTKSTFRSSTPRSK
jgi:hypothetical protein